MAFVPIQIDDYLDLHMKDNPAEHRGDLRAALRESLAASRAGKVCSCGNPIWVLGSAFVGDACFTRITGEATPETDFEIAEACPRHTISMRKDRRVRDGVSDQQRQRNQGDRK